MSDKIEWWKQIKPKDTIESNMEKLARLLLDTSDEEIMKKLNWKK